jgi:hypothetical protein
MRLCTNEHTWNSRPLTSAVREGERSETLRTAGAVSRAREHRETGRRLRARSHPRTAAMPTPMTTARGMTAPTASETLTPSGPVPPSTVPAMNASLNTTNASRGTVKRAVRRPCRQRRRSRLQCPRRPPRSGCDPLTEAARAAFARPGHHDHESHGHYPRPDHLPRHRPHRWLLDRLPLRQPELRSVPSKQRKPGPLPPTSDANAGPSFTPTRSSDSDRARSSPRRSGHTSSTSRVDGIAQRSPAPREQTSRSRNRVTTRRRS